MKLTGSHELCWLCNVLKIHSHCIVGKKKNPYTLPPKKPPTKKTTTISRMEVENQWLLGFKRYNSYMLKAILSRSTHTYTDIYSLLVFGSQISSTALGQYKLLVKNTQHNTVSNTLSLNTFNVRKLKSTKWISTVQLLYHSICINIKMGKETVISLLKAV